MTSRPAERTGAVPARRVGRMLGTGALALALGVPTLAAATTARADGAPSGPAPAQPLTLVTLQGAGTAAGRADAPELLARQDAALAAIGAGEPVYRWTTALNGFAAPLTEEQVAVLDDQPGIAAIEADTVRPLAARPATAAVDGAAASPRLRGGAGVVIGVVDSGIAPQSPAFAVVPGLGADPQGFAGSCAEGEGWTAEDCTRKVVGARWFVDGFGADRVRSSEALSPLDVLGHGTQVSSVAAGNAGVSVRVDGRDAGRFGGVAPQARIAAYKACWGAPDPADDGCSTADVVSAVDAAVADGVDVLTLALAGGEGVDTLQRALLGAAEADVVVMGAAGSAADASYAAHASPWVTTVGAAVGRMSRGRITVPGGQSWTGGGRPVDVRGRAVRAQDAAAPGVPRRVATQCRQGALDSRRVADRIVICHRGGIGRIDKSESVAQAGGRAMVLVNQRPGGVTADFHTVPTVHLAADAGRRLSQWVARHPAARLRMARVEGEPGTRRTAPWSAPGDPRGAALKPDAVADGDAVLGAVPDSLGRGWGVFSGSSAATAHASGLAALVLGEDPDRSAAVVRSLVVTSARPVPGSSSLEQGSGALPGRAPIAHLALDVDPAAWRRALRTHTLADLNTSSLLLSARQTTAVRRVTNIGRRAEYFSVTARGFTSHRVSVRPLAVRLAPGQSASFTVTVSGPRSPGRLDDGQLVWLGARGGVTRVPVALTR
ncbi:S8 family serine peptidase [Nocardioides sp. zg-1308]|uniref:S8 family serine peptidase n=1 Tax=Nocardioides sp. zg-1308 TaxID=2736253 RepID=UPI001552E677|nr:S8 family serine peptidase [Nocardioides sp. zg-1308]NPD05208.1 S8 family serine peptidase [Nocardioides sp. zg-1308]